MGWKRINGRSYFYEIRRENGRVRTIYRGAGIIGDLSEIRILAAREQREADREEQRHAIESERAEDREIDEAFERVEMLLRATLVRAGFHRPNRKWWRKR